MTIEEFRDKYREILSASKEYREKKRMSFSATLYLVEKILVIVRDNDKSAALQQLEVVRSNLLEYAKKYG